MSEPPLPSTGPRLTAIWRNIRGMTCELGPQDNRNLIDRNIINRNLIALFKRQDYWINQSLDNLDSGIYAAIKPPTRVLGLLAAMSKLVDAEEASYTEIVRSRALKNPVDIAALRQSILTLHADVLKQTPKHHARLNAEFERTEAARLSEAARPSSARSR